MRVLLANGEGGTLRILAKMLAIGPPNRPVSDQISSSILEPEEIELVRGAMEKRLTYQN